MIAISASSVAYEKSIRFKKEKFYFVHLHDVALGGHRNVAAVASRWRHCADLTESNPRPSVPIACARIELTAGTGPEIEPTTFYRDYDVCKHYANWSVWSTQNYDIASGTSTCVATCNRSFPRMPFTPPALTMPIDLVQACIFTF